MLLDTLKRTAAIVSLAAVVTMFTAGFAPAVTEAAPQPRGGARVVRYQPRPVTHGPSVHRPGPMPGRGPVIHQPGPRVFRGPHANPGPRPLPGRTWGCIRTLPPPQPRYDQREARRDRRIVRGVAAVGILAALFGGR